MVADTDKSDLEFNEFLHAGELISQRPAPSVEFHYGNGVSGPSPSGDHQGLAFRARLSTAPDFGDLLRDYSALAVAIFA